MTLLDVVSLSDFGYIEARKNTNIKRKCSLYMVAVSDWDFLSGLSAGPLMADGLDDLHT